MGNVEIVKACHWHILPVGNNIRQADYDEVKASCGLHPITAISEGVKMSTKSWTALYNGKPACIFGVTPVSIMTGTGCPWMLGTSDILKMKRKFLIKSKDVVKEMLEICPILINYVDTRNKVSIRWLRWLGFTVYDPEPYGLNGEPFHRFEMRASDV